MRELDVKPGFACNNNCVFCLNQEKKFCAVFPLEDILGRIAQAARKGCAKLIISGGEPSISPNFFTILDFAKKNGYREIELQTNARMLSYEAFVEKLLARRPVSYKFLISLHFPDKKLQKKYTRADGFDQVIGGIKNLVKHGLPVRINTVVMKPNLKLLGDVTAVVRSIGVKSQQFRMVSGQNFRERYAEFVPPMSDAAREIRKVIKKNRDALNFAIHELPLCVVGKDMEEYMSPPTNPERDNLSIGNIVVPSPAIMRKQFVFAGCCAACSIRAACKGVRSDYAELYGLTEVKPLRK